jgi:hypothetical protein
LEIGNSQFLKMKNKQYLCTVALSEELYEDKKIFARFFDSLGIVILKI